MKLTFRPARSVWLRFFIMYGIIVTTIVMITIPIYQTALRVSRDKAILDSILFYSEKFSRFEKSLREFYHVPAIMEENEAYLQIKTFSGTKAPIPYYYKMNSPRYQFYLSVANNDFINNAFIYFPGSDFIIAKDRVFADIGTEFRQFIDYHITTDELRSMLAGQKGRWHFIPSTEVTFMDTSGEKHTEEVLTYVVNSSDGLAYAGAIIGEDTLKELFDLIPYGVDAFGILTDNTDRTIYSRNYSGGSFSVEKQQTPMTLNGRRFLLLSFPMKNLGCNAIVGIPDSYFTDSVRPVKRLVNFFIILAVMIGAIISTTFARFNYRPIQELVHNLAEHGRPPRSRKMDEFAYIGESLENYSTENETLNRELSSIRKRFQDSIFIQLLQGNIITEDGRKLALGIFPLVSDRFRVALIQFQLQENARIDEIPSLLVDTTFAHSPLSKYITGQIDSRHLAILLEETPDWMEHLGESVETIRNNMRMLYGIDLKVGISNAGSGTAEVHTAYEQAKYALFSEKEQTVLMYQAPAGTVKVLESNIIQKLYTLTLAGEIDTIVESLEEIKKALIGPSSPGPDRAEEYTFLLRFVLHNIITEQQLDIGENRIPSYQSSTNIEKLFQGFKDCFEEVCRAIAEKRLSNNQSLKNDIVEYIRQNYTDPQFDIVPAAARFHLSEQHVYRLIREHTGQSFGAYVEKLRIELAIRLLRDTTHSVSSISTDCGFNVVNTFYRVFKKHYGVTPSTYRRKLEYR